MQRRLRSRRSSSSLPGVIDLILSRPIVSATMIAKEVDVTPRGALNLIAELGVRVMTGRGRYRAWGILWKRAPTDPLSHGICSVQLWLAAALAYLYNP